MYFEPHFFGEEDHRTISKQLLRKEGGGPGGTHKAKANAFRKMAHAISGSGFLEEENM
jgi:hypothetical protein